MTLDVYSDLFDSDLDAVAANLYAVITAVDAEPAGDSDPAASSCGIEGRRRADRPCRKRFYHY
jgi:hypothetical protein